MDLSVIANWAQIIGAVQQIPSTILAIRGMLHGHNDNGTVEALSKNLTGLLSSFDVLEELKVLHDQTQIIHNVFQKVHAATSGGAANIQVEYVTRIWRSVRTSDFPAFFTQVSSFRHISGLVTDAEIKGLQDGISELDSAVKQLNLNQIIDGADDLQHKIVALLTKADIALKQAIHELFNGVSGVERGLRV